MKRRYYRWIEMGVIDGMLAMLAREAGLEWLMIDSTIVRAHQHAVGARKENGGKCPGPVLVSRLSEHQGLSSRRRGSMPPPTRSGFPCA